LPRQQLFDAPRWVIGNAGVGALADPDDSSGLSIARSAAYGLSGGPCCCDGAGTKSSLALIDAFGSAEPTSRLADSFPASLPQPSFYAALPKRPWCHRSFTLLA